MNLAEMVFILTQMLPEELLAWHWFTKVNDSPCPRGATRRKINMQIPIITLLGDEPGKEPYPLGAQSNQPCLRSQVRL